MKPDLLTVMGTDPTGTLSNTALPAMSVTAERSAPEAGVTHTAAPETTVVVVTSTLRVAAGGGGFTVIVALRLTPPALAVIDTVVAAETW